MKKSILLGIIFLWIFGNTLKAQTLQLEADAYLVSILEKYNIPGLSAGIAKNGKIIWTGVAGHKDIDHQQQVDSTTIFRTASISKAITATAIFQLVEKGKLDLNAPIQQYLPDYPTSKKGTITILHLLSHTSGISHYKGNENRHFIHYPNLNAATQLFENRRLLNKPGKKYRYTSYGYTILGAIIEKVTGQSFGEYLHQHIFKIVGMQTARLDNRKEKDINQAELYQLKEGQIIKEVSNDLSLIYPAGGINMSATDLLKFVLAFENGQLITRASKERMLQAPVFNGKILNEHGALGWDIWTDPNFGKGYSKVGGQAGASSLVLHLRDKQLTVVLLSNLTYLSPIWEIVNHLRDLGLHL